MRDSAQATTAHPPSSVSVMPAPLPPDVVRLVDVLARIERRRQARISAEHALQRRQREAC